MDTWSIDLEPIQALGVEQRPTAFELRRLSDAVSLPGARLVVGCANQRPWVGLLIDNQTGATCALGARYEPLRWHHTVP